MNRAFVAALAVAIASGCHCADKVKKDQATASETPSFVDFGTIPVGTTVTTDETNSPVVKNESNLPISVADLKLRSGNSGPFSVSPAGQQITPGGSFHVPVTFTPTAEGPVNDVLEIDISGATPPSFQVALSGNGGPGYRVVVSPIQHDFGEVMFNSTASVTVTLENTGTEGLTLLQPAMQTSASTDFGSGVLSTLALGPKVVSSALVTFTPSKTEQNATATFLFRSTNHIFQVPVTVTGSCTPHAQIWPPDADFGSSCNATVITPIQVDNTGYCPLNVRAQLSAATDTAFKLNLLGGGGATTVAPNPPGYDGGSAAVAFQVQFDATGSQVYSGELDLYTDDPSNPLIKIPLTGQGTCADAGSVTTPAPNFPCDSCYALQVWPLNTNATGRYADGGQACTAANGNLYPATGAGAAVWTNFTDCGTYKDFGVNPSTPYKVVGRGDGCGGCFLYYDSFDIQEVDGGGWWSNYSYKNPAPAPYDFYAAYYRPKSGLIRVLGTDSPQGYYMAVCQFVPDAGCDAGN